MKNFLFYQEKKHLIPDQKPIFAPSQMSEASELSSTDGSLKNSQSSKMGMSTFGQTGFRGIKKNKYKSDTGLMQPELDKK